MVEVANLKIRYSADVENAIGGLKQVDQKMNKSATVAATESKKIEGFMGKWTMGWIAMGTAAIASLYAIAKSSAVISSYFEEFGMMIGDVFDTIGIAMAPIVEPLLDFLWGLVDIFNALPDPVKAATGAVIFFLAGLLTLIPILALLKSSLATLGLSAAGAKILALGGPLTALGVIIVGAAYGYYVTWKDAWDKMGKEPGTAWAVMKTGLMTIFGGGGMSLYLAAGIADILGFGDEFQDTIDRILVYWILLWTDKIPRAMMRGLTTIHSYASAWYDAGARLVSSLIYGIGDLGDKIWSSISGDLAYVSNQLSAWASGLLSFSPTLLEIGARIPQTITRGAVQAEPIMTRSIAHTTIPMIATEGRTVVEKNVYQFTIPINIYGGISSDRDLRELARRLKGHMQRELKTLGRT